MYGTRVEVEHLGEGGLERELWVFEVLRFPQVVLEHYGQYARKTKRHKWRMAGDRYDRLHVDRHEPGNRLKEEPDVPEDVMNEAMQLMRDKMKFEKWSRR